MTNQRPNTQRLQNIYQTLDTNIKRSLLLQKSFQQSYFQLQQQYQRLRNKFVLYEEIIQDQLIKPLNDLRSNQKKNLQTIHRLQKRNLALNQQNLLLKRNSKESLNKSSLKQRLYTTYGLNKLQPSKKSLNKSSLKQRLYTTYGLNKLQPQRKIFKGNSKKSSNNLSQNLKKMIDLQRSKQPRFQSNKQVLKKLSKKSSKKKNLQQDENIQKNQSLLGKRMKTDK